MIVLHIGCPVNKSLTDKPPDLSRYRVGLSKVPHKADINIHNQRITVDREYWNRLSDDGKRLLLFHEIAHLQNSGCAKSCEGKPLGCERCADNRAGACLALSGFTVERMRSAVREMRMSRNTFEGDVSAGFFSAFRRLNGTQYTQPNDIAITSGMTTSTSGNLSVVSTPDAGIPESKQPAPMPPEIDGPAKAPPPSGVENVPQCACKTAGRNWEWIIGAAGGLFALGIVISGGGK